MYGSFFYCKFSPNSFEKYLEDIKDNPSKYGITCDLEIVYNGISESGGSNSGTTLSLAYTLTEDGKYYVITGGPHVDAHRCDTPTKRFTTISDAGTLTSDFETGIYDLTAGTQILYSTYVSNTTSDGNGRWHGAISLIVIKIG